MRRGRVRQKSPISWENTHEIGDFRDSDSYGRALNLMQELLLCWRDINPCGGGEVRQMTDKSRAFCA